MGITRVLRAVGGVSGWAQLLVRICFKGKAGGKGLDPKETFSLEARKCSVKT